MAPTENSGAWGTLIHEKNLKSKISCQTPFKNGDFLGLFNAAHLSPLKFHYVGGYWDRTQDCCDHGVGRARHSIHSTIGLIRPLDV
jgi:hypothetical protein